MMPVYGYMDSNTHQRNQAPFPQHYFPGFEAVPPHFKVDPFKSPMMYESWPCSSNSKYPVPYDGCCNHGNFPGYYTCRPPCLHFAPSPAFHQYPNYPTFPEAYPVYYAPPPHYSNEQPRYEYDKDAHTNYHCCGCPNHLYNQKNDRSLKIEEQEPDAEKKEGDSVVPIQPRSYPYPIVWIPPEYMKNKEYGNRNNQPEVSDWDKAPRFVKPREKEPNSDPIVWIPSEYMKSKECGKRNDQPEVSDWDKAPCFVKPSKSLKPTEQQPRVWNGWFPLDMNGLKSLMQGEGEKKSQNQHKMTQFPFPIFWVPSDGKQEEDENQDKRRMITASDHSKQAPVNSEFIPVEPSVSDVKINKPQSDKEVSQNKNASATKGNTANQTMVPIEDNEGKSEGIEKRERDVSVKRIEDTAKNELGTIAKRKSLSPPKTSKLPPVCLRVDPLPKKRNGNGSSGSPSPPKGQPQDTLTKTSIAPGLKEDFAVNTQNLNGRLDNVEPGERKRKDIQVIEERSEENKAGESTSASQAQDLGNLPINSQEVLGKPTMERSEKDSHESKTEEEKNACFEEVMGAEKESDIVKAANPDESAHGQFKAEIKRMSDAEAAKLIQSAFRGFEVRKWEPLKKLKQIAKVREQVDEIRNRIQSLESSSDLNKDDRQRLLIGETIMTLLLKLDTIQGLHSSVREVRKSLVRELVTLQEKLDSLTSKWAEEKAKELGTAESADCPSDQACRNVSVEKESKNASAAFEDTNENRNNIKEPDQEYLTHMVDGKDEETIEPPIVEQDLDGKMENNTTKATCDIECHTAPRIEHGDVSSNLDHMTRMSSVPEQKSEAEGKFVEANDLTREAKPEMVEVNDLTLVDNNSEDDKLRSLPKADYVDAVCEPGKEIGNSNVEKESDLPINPALPAEAENLRWTKKDQEIDLLKEMPVGIIDEEPAISKIEKCGLHETGEINTLSEDCLAGNKLEVQLLEAASNNSVKNQKENKFTNNPELEVEEEQQEVNNDNKFESFFKPEELPSTVGEENNEKLQQQEDDSGVIPADQMASSESEAESDATQEKEVLFEEKKEAEQPVATEEKEEVKLENEIEVQEQECMNNEEKINMLLETAEERVLFEKDAPSESNVKQEFLPASPATSQMLEHDSAKIGGDNKLIEENKKLREIMEKLMEAGKDQLSVISNLTERVKDLEEKLSRNKKSSKPRYRKARYAPSYSKPMRARKWDAEVAIVSRGKLKRRVTLHMLTSGKYYMRGIPIHVGALICH